MPVGMHRAAVQRKCNVGRDAVVIFGMVYDDEVDPDCSP